MSGFPINLDLSEYFDDLRKYSSIFINLSKFKDVSDVENHIKSVFGLEDNICLVQKKFLIPKSEDIKILEQYDIFKVQKCNFYDLQIHKTKKVINNSNCDQKALNLTQSEKTIDLSCRPKQRLKANTCPSPGVSRTPSLLIDHKKCTDSQMNPCEQTVLLNGNQNNMPKEKTKSKKKKYLQNDVSQDDDDNDVSGSILDMSVNNSLRKKHSNCFSTDDGSLLSDGDGANDNYRRDVVKDHHKKSKKRKKNSEGIDDASVDLASTFWESLCHGDGSTKDLNVKKKPKKAKEDILNYSFSTHINKVSVKSELNDIVANKTIDDECSAKTKTKHSKKYEESKSLYDSEENQYYSSTSMYTSKNHKKTSSPKTFFDTEKKERNSELSTLEEHKKNIKRDIDQMLTEMQENSTDLSCQNDGRDTNSVVFSNHQPLSENNLQINREQSGSAENITEESSKDLDYNSHKRRRKRKHNKKKSKEKLSYMLAVGPTINRLTAQPVIKTSPSSEISKHVYFTEDDFVEDMTVPPTPPVKPQTVTESSQPVDGKVEAAQSQGESSSLPATWQDHLLKLASSGSKPSVYHRNTSTATTSQTVTSHSSHPIDSNQADVNTADRSDQANPAADVTSRTVEVKSNNDNGEGNSLPGTVDGCSPRKGLPDICKPLPIPNDLQNINLSDYPIIDKVVAEDLILFKVLKLNENGEPGVSKPLLARVSDTSNFPDRIALQIMEGCEECSHCTQSERSEEPFNLELRWCDILEPRLFYP